MSRLVVVGEMNPYGIDPRMALFHLPIGASGDRLRRIFALKAFDYLALERVNLCEDKWTLAAARNRARVLAGGVVPGVETTMVILGAKVRSAFNHGQLDHLTWFSSTPFLAQGVNRLQAFTLVLLPHPSGLSRAWNTPGAVDRARTLLRAAAPWVPWGSDPTATLEARA